MHIFHIYSNIITQRIHSITKRNYICFPKEHLLSQQKREDFLEGSNL